jgi:hypothetical protein
MRNQIQITRIAEYSIMISVVEQRYDFEESKFSSYQRGEGEFANQCNQFQLASRMPFSQDILLSILGFTLARTMQFISLLGVLVCSRPLFKLIDTQLLTHPFEA